MDNRPTNALLDLGDKNIIKVGAPKDLQKLNDEQFKSKEDDVLFTYNSSDCEIDEDRTETSIN